MRKHIKLLLMMAFLAGFPCLVHAAASHVQGRLLADPQGIAPAKPFFLGVQLTIDPGWHVYWKNPGDAGAATRVKLELPPGFTAGELQFPTPSRFDQPGDIVAYGYEKSVLLLVEIMPPKDLGEHSHFVFKAAVSWLTCADVCIPGKEILSIELGAGVEFKANHTDLFNNWKAQLPVPALKSTDVVHISASGEVKSQGASGTSGSGSIVLEIQWKQAAPQNVQFLPGTLDLYNIKEAKVQTQGDKTRITFSLEVLAGKSVSSATLDLVVGFNDKDGAHRGVSVAISLPKAEIKQLEP